MKWFKNFFSYQVFLVIFISFICFLLFGSILRHHYLGGKQFLEVQKVAIFFAELPSYVNKMIQSKSININKPPVLKKHSEKKNFNQILTNKREALLILPIYDHDLGKSLVKIIDLNNFETIHTYQHNVLEMWKQVTNIKEFPNLHIDDSPIRFEYRHPLLLKDGSLIADSDYTPIFKIDYCSNLIWINDEESFHHSKMLDHENNIWIPAKIYPHSKYVGNNQIKEFFDDAVIKINTDGKILFKKSVIEILIQNKIVPKNFAINSILSNSMDPIHLNDIEPVFFDGKFWKKGDIFLSTPSLNAIIHFRPETNKVINYITGPFTRQHDVDIISNKEISIFNNNNSITENEFSEILIYNFETKNFKKIFNNQLTKEDFKTEFQGLSYMFKDGALMVEEQGHGRIILFDNEGNKEWEFVNKSKNGYIGFISWSRVIEDKIFIRNYKKIIENKKCIN
tara:strand:- start:570 stop:1925 length:1356 start_codon:yes stop_codon:yes gene_type:complete